MTCNDIIKNAFTIVGETDIAENFETFSSSSAGWSKLQKMICAINIVNQDLATDYFPVLVKEGVSGKQILYSSLLHEFVFCKKVLDSFGRSIDFREFASFLECAENAKTIVYATVPSKLEIGSEIEIKCPQNVLVYGAICEYFLQIGNYEDAEIFDDKFKQVLSSALFRHKEIVIPRQRWV